MRDSARGLSEGRAVHSRRLGPISAGRLIPIAVIAAIAAFLLVPVRQQLFPKSAPKLRPLQFEELPAAPRIPFAATVPAEWSPAVRTLILYDHSGKWGWLGGLDATLTANLVGHFGRWDAKPAATYERGELERYTATIYLGSVFGERLPSALLGDVLRTHRPVIWVADNIEQLEKHADGFRARYGWQTSVLDHSAVAEVRYKGGTLTRWTRNASGIMRYSAIDRSRVRILARAMRSDGSTFPWAVRSRNLTYLGEMPFTYTSETDRVLIFDDLLFDALAPQTRERHRALVRLEDINPLTHPSQLRAAADYLHAHRIPFGFGVSPYYRDPQGHDDPPYQLLLHQAPQVVAALKYLERKGGVPVEHGYTHQWDGGKNPYDGETGDDVEFYRVTETPAGQVRNVGPLPGDTSPAWAEHRIVAANRAFVAAGLAPPKIFEFPHYIASDHGYRAAARWFAARWERSDYFAGLLGDGPIQYDHIEGQFFPYVVHDVYGSKVLPENLGSIAPSTWHTYKERLPADIVRAARANLVVRDGFAAFYFHPFLKLSYLKQAIKGIQAAGYTFVSPDSL
jgi:uncharacterized protein YdaL